MTTGRKPLAEVVGSTSLMLVDVESIVLDPDQPRHVLPADLRERLVSGENPRAVIQEAWIRCVGEPLAEDVSVGDLSPSNALAQRRLEGVLDAQLQLVFEGDDGLLALAESIALHGMRHPINLYRIDGDSHFRIAEGERRWLALLYLRYVCGCDDASPVEARVMLPPEDDLTILGRQVVENFHRREHSAIARARLVARLRAAVVAEMQETQPATWTDTRGPGRPRNVEVAIEAEIAKRTGKKLGDLVGSAISGRMVRYYLALLTLPQEAQGIAEASGLGERALRPLLQLDDPDLQAEYVRQMALGLRRPGDVAAEISGPAGSQLTQTLRRSVVSLSSLAAQRAAARRAARDIADLDAEHQRELRDRMRRTIGFLQQTLQSLTGD